MYGHAAVWFSWYSRKEQVSIHRRRGDGVRREGDAGEQYTPSGDGRLYYHPTLWGGAPNGHRRDTMSLVITE